MDKQDWTDLSDVEKPFPVNCSLKVTHRKKKTLSEFPE